ncbi:MAG: amino acid adenylation domain-containing protein, partial [Anaerolineae bacterium]
VDTISYQDLANLSDQVRDRLWQMGVRPGDRVGVYLDKSIDALAAIFGILKTGAAYVPVDPTGPIERNCYILMDCGVTAVILDQRFAQRLTEETAAFDRKPGFFLVAGTGGGHPLQQALAEAHPADPARPVPTRLVKPEDLAYILYTSGSTGKPKGVMLSHENAVSYVDWCSDTFSPTDADRFSSHAPFHFDLSIFDIYVPLKHGATLVLVSDGAGKDPLKLAKLISEQRISVWYSTPSILSFLAQYGHLQDYLYDQLRIVLFAGEVFPIKHLRLLKEKWPHPDYYNLYGPTETNVCTWLKLPARIPPEKTQPFSIGRACSHVKTRVVDENGQEVAVGEEGELVVTGAGVMQGYWNLPERTAAVFWVGEDGRRWYKTGDIVVEESNENYTFVGRRDRMVKKRGYRIELGEIEAALYRHAAVKEAAVITLADELAVVKVKAFVSWEGEGRPSIIKMKQFCAANLPTYMIPDLFSFPSVLPKTSTDKIDYQKLQHLT